MAFIGSVKQCPGGEHYPSRTYADVSCSTTGSPRHSIRVKERCHAMYANRSGLSLAAFTVLFVASPLEHSFGSELLLQLSCASLAMPSGGFLFPFILQASRVFKDKPQRNRRD